MREREGGRGKIDMRKRTRISVMEVSTQVAGVRTRARTVALAAAAAAAAAEVGVSSKRRKAAAKVGGKQQKAYLQLRSRILVMTKRKPNSVRNSGEKRLGNAEQGGISRCSSIASCELVKDEDLRFPSSGDDHKICENDLRSSMCCFESNRESWREITASSTHVIDAGELVLDSSSERKSRQSSPPSATAPITAEIEEFFAAAEKSEKHRFASVYNFDIDEEVPLEGRYDWVRINP